jgi:ribosome biogenesis GTPase
VQHLKKLGWDQLLENEKKSLTITDQIIGRITNALQNAYIVKADKTYRTTLPGKLLKDIETADIPVVGDFVLIKKADEENAVIRHIFKRKTEIARKYPDKRKENVFKKQILAANIDLAFIFASLNRDFNIKRIERYITMVKSGGIKPVLILSKSDLTNEKETFKEKLSSLNIEKIYLSNITGEGIEQIRSQIKENQTAILLGSSGVGKSTLINNLVKDANQQTQNIREIDMRGKHTTVNREMFFMENGGIIIDTPGLREVGLTEENTDKTVFADIERIAENCKFSDCTHIHEPGCAIKKALEKGEISKDHYENYIKLDKESKKSQATHKQKMLDKRSKNKKIAKDIKRLKKHKNKF